MSISLSLYIYIHIDRERERERERDTVCLQTGPPAWRRSGRSLPRGTRRPRPGQQVAVIYIYIYMYIYIYTYTYIYIYILVNSIISLVHSRGTRKFTSKGIRRQAAVLKQRNSL